MEHNEQNEYQHTKVSGAINQHTPSYWRLALPALGVRYIGRYAQELIPKLKNTRFFDAIAGGWMLVVTGFFANRTAQDMKSIFAETVAYELDKKPADVTFNDIMQSENKAIATARHNFIKYTGARLGVNSLFFASFLPGPFKNTPSVDLGMGANSAYLVAEVLGRGRTFFEQLQSFTDSKLNQKKALGDDIAPHELLQLFERNAEDNDPQNMFKGRVDTIAWKQGQVIFERMAELMNNTYQHKHENGAANFTLPKFLYLLGHNLIQPLHVEQTMAYVEVANRYGMSALKNVVKEVKNGTLLADALQTYPVKLLEVKEYQIVDDHVVPVKTVRVDAPHAKDKKYSDHFTPHAGKPHILPQPVAFADKVAESQTTGAVLGG